MLNTGSIFEGQIEIDESLQPTGGIFGRAFRPEAVALPNWGELEFRLDCNGGSATYSTDLPSFSDGRQELVPLTRLRDSGCMR